MIRNGERSPTDDPLSGGDCRKASSCGGGRLGFHHVDSFPPTTQAVGPANQLDALLGQEVAGGIGPPAVVPSNTFRERICGCRGDQILRSHVGLTVD
jgi:hypothetical protein